MRAPFVFQSTAMLARFAGLSADSARALQRAIARAPETSIFYHLHFAIFRRHFMTSELMNDFARWAWGTLGDEPLAEQLAAVDPLEFTSLREARARLVSVIGDWMGQTDHVHAVGAKQRFYFVEGQSFVYPTGERADSVRSLADAVRRAPAESIFHHFVAAPLRLGRRDNDFSHWLETEQGATHAAERIRQLSPYQTDLFQLGETIAQLL